jgi:hypothetical protein
MSWTSLCAFARLWAKMRVRVKMTKLVLCSPNFSLALNGRSGNDKEDWSKKNDTPVVIGGKSCLSDEASMTFFFSFGWIKTAQSRPSFSFSFGLGLSSVRRAQAIPGFPRPGWGLRTKQKREKRQAGPCCRRHNW